MAIIEAGEARVDVAQAGEGRNLVLLHSLLTDRSVFDRVAPALSRKRRLTLRPTAKLSESVRRHGGDFESYLAERDPKSGKLPAYLVKVREGNEESVRYFHDQREVREFHEENLDLNLFDAEMGQELLPLTTAPVKSNGGVRRRAKLVRPPFQRGCSLPECSQSGRPEMSRGR